MEKSLTSHDLYQLEHSARSSVSFQQLNFEFQENLPAKSNNLELSSESMSIDSLDRIEEE